MEWRCVMLFLMFTFKTVDRVRGSCNLSLKNDFGSPSPVFLRSGGFLVPNSAGDILLRRAETLQAACPGNNKFVVLGNDTTTLGVINLKCVSDTTFRAMSLGWVGLLREVRCSAPPWFTAERTDVNCSGGLHIYRVGYRISDQFHSLYEACFDNGLLTTRYVKHELSPTSRFGQAGGRPQFIEGDLFPEVRMSALYKMSQQKDRLATVLGPGMEDKYITKKQFLNRGHFAANADFSMRASQRATFHYINAAPQWMRGNAGDWAALEEALRRRLATYNSSVVVYTGTHGVCTLVDRGGTPRPIYLHTDENNNEVVPVPLYFYKLVYDPRKKLAAVFLSINSPHYNSSEINDLSFCSDICEGNKKYSWLKWRANDATHSFCCEYSDFVREIKGLPPLDVRGLFY